MSISIGAYSQSNNYYDLQNASGAAARPLTTDANAQNAIAKTGNSAQNSQITDKSDPNYVCQTCKQRRYQDQSNDPSVSFKSPGYISPGSSAAVVASHEQEHVTNEQAQASEQGRRVVSQSVVLKYAVCPECHKSYVSGGETKTVTASDSSYNNKSNQNLLDVRV